MGVLRRSLVLGGLVAVWFGGGCSAPVKTVRLSALDLTHTRQGWGQPQKDCSVVGDVIRLSGQSYEHGLGTHSDSILWVDLSGHATRFKAIAGLDDDSKESVGSVRFFVYGDEKRLFDSGVIKAGQEAVPVDVDVTGIQRLALIVDDGGDGGISDHADWAQARFEYSGTTPKTMAEPIEEAVILTPKPDPKPRLNGAKVFGVRPGSPVLFTIAATGDRPMQYSALDLPEGLHLDAESGQLSGRLLEPGTYNITLVAENPLGRAEGPLRIVVGEGLALTPPMGWNSWACWGGEIDEPKIRAAAQAMADSGLIQHGWSYINIDGGWAAPGNRLRSKTLDQILPAGESFKDMKALTDFIHGLGLKAGIYAESRQFPPCDPSPETSWARQLSEWGFDYLKYKALDYQGNDLAALQEPYHLMKAALDEAERDVILGLCQFGFGKVWEWGQAVGGNSWRTTGDIEDTWPRTTSLGFGQRDYGDYAGPGHWNDPDLLMLGRLGDRQTRLTPHEQMTQMSLWCMLSAPLLLSCDLTVLDAFTVGLLTNDEVLAINQDTLGRQARRVIQRDQLEVWVKDLEEGARVVALFNRSWGKETIRADWKDLGLSGRQAVRDLWCQKDLGVFTDAFETSVPRHGTVLIRLTPLP